jgi:hypothetical protein
MPPPSGFVFNTASGSSLPKGDLLDSALHRKRGSQHHVIDGKISPQKQLCLTARPLGVSKRLSGKCCFTSQFSFFWQPAVLQTPRLPTVLPRDQPGVHRNRDFDRRGLSGNIDDQIIQSVLRKRKGEVLAERRGRNTLSFDLKFRGLCSALREKR